MSPLPSSLSRALLVEHHAAVGAARHLEADAGRQVRLDEAGDHVHRRLLRRQDQVNAGGAATSAPAG